MFHALNDAALDQLFRTARTYNAFSGEVDEAVLRRLYDLVKLGPTAANSSPARFVFVTSLAAKARLIPALDEGNQAKTRAAPVTVIVGYDLDFHDKMSLLFPHVEDARSWFDGPRDGRFRTAHLNCSLQAAYLIVAARALGLDAGPMSGFDHEAVDAAFFQGTQIRSSMLINLGKGDPASIFPRLPRLPFDEIARIE